MNVDAPAAVEELVRDAIALGRELGSVRTPTLAKLAGARAAVRAGRPDVGARQLRAAREAVRTRRIKVMAGDVAEAGAMFALDRGAWSAAIDAARELAVALRAVPMSLWNPVPSLIRGRALLGAGRAGDALPVLDQAVAAARASSADGTLALARVYRVQAGLLAGRRPGAVPASASSIREAELAAVVAETAGVAALRRDDPAAALDAFDEAVERWSAFGASSWLARASALRAEALRACGDRARAAASSGRARAIAERIGMPKPERASIEHPFPG